MIKVINKFIHCSDWHLGIRGLSRMDKIHEIQQQSVRKIFQFAKDHDAHIFNTGDLFDRENFNYREFDWLFALYREFDITEKNMTIIGGNHDLFQKNPKFIKESLVNIVLELHKNPYDNIKAYHFGEERTNEPVQFILLHEFVDNNNVQSIIDQHSNAEFILCGDHHQAFMVKKGKTTLLNAGSLVRCAINEPYPSFFYVEDGNVLTIDLIDTNKESFSVTTSLLTKKIVDITEDAQSSLDEKGTIQSKNPNTNTVITYEKFMETELEEKEYIRFEKELEMCEHTKESK